MVYLDNKNKKVDKFGKKYNYTVLAVCLMLKDQAICKIDLSDKKLFSTGEHKELAAEGFIKLLI